MIKWIEQLLLLFIFLIPWQARWVIRAGEIGGGFWEYGSISLYATDVIFLIILALSVIQFVRHNPLQLPLTLRGRDRSAPPLKIRGVRGVMKVGAWLVFAGYILLSIFWSFDKPVAFYAVVKLFEGIALFFIVRKFQCYEVGLPKQNSEDRLRIVSLAFIASAVVQSLLAIAQFFTQSVFAWPWSGIAPQDPSDLGVSVIQFADERWLRAYGSFPHPNLLGAFLTIALLLLLSKFLLNPSHPPFSKREGDLPPFLKGERGGFGFMFHVSCFMLIVTGLFFTFSRAAWIAFFVGLIVYAIQTKAWKEKIFLQITLLLVVIASVLTILFFPLVRTRVGGGSRLEMKSNQERTTGYREAVQLIRRHPFFGVGIGNYTVAVARELRPNDPSWSYQPVHNVFFLILSELGLIGFLIFLTPFIPLTLRGRRGVYSLPLILTLAILASFDHSLWTLHSGILLLWGAIALFDLNITRSDLQKEDRPRSLPPS